MLKLMLRNLVRHPMRSLLTMGSLTVALFLLVLLKSLITTMNAGVDLASAQRLAVMSSTGLFVALPLNYQPDLASVKGVEHVMKFQWFGGYFRDPSNFFGQFAVDPEQFFSMYPEVEVPPEQRAAFLGKRTSCLIGSLLANEFGWKVGDTVPLIGAQFPHPSGGAWEFEVAGIYHSKQPNFDNRTLFFHWNYFQETLESGTGETPSVGVYSMFVEKGASVPGIIADVEGLYENGPQRVQCTTEAEFSRQFVDMMGPLPLFMGAIGTGVLLAILMACVNTMLMAAREQTQEIGVLKALGFTDRSMVGYFVTQSLVLCVVGGALGIALAVVSEQAMVENLGAMFPNYTVANETVILACVLTLGLGLVSGIVPAWMAARLRSVEVMREVA